MAKRQTSGYTPEQIDYEAAGVLTLGNDELRSLVANALSKVPKRVADKVLAGCLFLMPMRHYEDGYYIPEELLRNRCVLALPDKLLEEDTEMIEHVILHEVAHFHHSHISSLCVEECSEDRARQQEEEAEMTVARWLEGFRNS